MAFRRIGILTIIFLGCISCGRTNDAHLSALSDDEVFILGSLEDPPLQPPGPGAGDWNSEEPSAYNTVLANAAYVYFLSADAKRRYGDIAAGAFWHYFSNDGSPYVIDVARLLKDVPSARRNFERLLNKARQLVAAHPCTPLTFTSAAAQTSVVTRAEGRNWYLAMAGYSYYLKGRVDQTSSGWQATYYFYIWDRYDWVPGITIPIATPLGRVNIDQEWIGEFHRQGLAKEFSTVGVYRLAELLSSPGA